MLHQHQSSCVLSARNLFERIPVYLKTVAKHPFLCFLIAFLARAHQPKGNDARGTLVSIISLSGREKQSEVSTRVAFSGHAQTRRKAGARPCRGQVTAIQTAAMDMQFVEFTSFV